MARLIEMIKQSAVPAGVMRSASRGALAVPAAEMLEILVYLADHPLFGEQARMTLAGFDEAGSITALSDANAPREVLNYFLAPRNRRPKLLPALFSNPSVSEDVLVAIAETASHETTQLLLSSERVMNSSALLKALIVNPYLNADEYARIGTRLADLGVSAAEEHGTVTDHEVLDWMREHAHELEQEEKSGAAFALVGGIDEHGEHPAEVNAQTIAAAAGKEDGERLSVLQKLSRMTVGERIKVAMLGTKEERGILIRDGSRLVSSAVLASPKLSDAEVEGIANMKNVQENVLREIARSHKFMKSYIVVRNLCNNPRTPLDLSMGMMKNLLNPDLKILSINKNVPETLRKSALRMFQQRTSPGGGKGGE